MKRCASDKFGISSCQHEGGSVMATRDSMDELMLQCEQAIAFAEEQYKEGSLQEHYNNDDYTRALQMLEESYNDIAKMAHSANSQQRDQLHRMRLQLQQLQNSMILEGQDYRGGGVH
jgi:uncharacterized protein YutE (UPF0331/DUF86 family)